MSLKLHARDQFSEAEEAVVREAISEVRQFPAGGIIVRAGAPLQESCLLIDGLVSRYKDLANGERQIQELHVAGDFVDLHGFLLKSLDHHIGAVSDCRLAIVPHERLKHITEEYPHLSRMLWFSTMLDASIQRETILSVGRRSALARVAHFMCELCVRLQVVGLSDGKGFSLPMTQTDLADTTGLTSVHVNRMLKQLRDQRILTFRHSQVVIHDWDGLAETAEFDPSYLHLDRQPR